MAFQVETTREGRQNTLAWMAIILVGVKKTSAHKADPARVAAVAATFRGTVVVALR
jgi:hypothetical protein